MRKLHQILLGGLLCALPVVACSNSGSSSGDLDDGSTGGSGEGGSGNAPSSGGSGNSPGTGGNGIGGEGGSIVPPPPGVPFSVDDCNATNGPSQKVKDSDIGAFAGDATWMDGWTNWSSSANKKGLVIPKDVKDSEGNITTQHVFTFSGDLTNDQLNWTKENTYILNGYVRVPEGKTLTIEAGTVVQGKKTDANEAGTLFVVRGAKLNAVGTKDAPIVFTSAKADGAKAAGDWGGIVLLGKAHVRQHPISYEGLSGAGFEWAMMGVATEDESINDDNSGELKYIRIEFGGAVLTSNKEINGLSLGAVGSGTKISYIQVNGNKDDCFEWFGGTVNADHLVCNNSGDDQYDADDSYQGTIDHAFARGTINSSSDPSGLEWDGVSDISSPTESVITTVTLKHATLCGALGQFGVPAYGAVLRRGIKGSLEDVFFTGWDVTFDPRDNFELGGAGTPNVTLKDVASAQAIDGVTYTEDTSDCLALNADLYVCNDDLGFDEAAWFADGEGDKDWDDQ